MKRLLPVFTLECPRTNLTIDPNPWTKKQCETYLLEVLNNYPEIGIASVAFPFFDQITLNKRRPVLTFFNNQTKARFNLAIYMGRLDQDKEWYTPLSPSVDLIPGSAAVHTIDLTKVCTFPLTVHPNDMPTWAYWYDHESARMMALINPDELRLRLVEQFRLMLVNISHLDYTDFTRSLDEGEIVRRSVMHEGELCWSLEIFK